MGNYQDIEARELSHCPEDTRNRYVLVDVRTDEEFRDGHIPNALHIPLDQLEERYQELERYKEQKILLVCRSGRRSALAAEFLAGAGFQHLYNLKGGMLEWTGPVKSE